MSFYENHGLDLMTQHLWDSYLVNPIEGFENNREGTFIISYCGREFVVNNYYYRFAMHHERHYNFPDHSEVSIRIKIEMNYAERCFEVVKEICHTAWDRVIAEWKETNRFVYVIQSANWKDMDNFLNEVIKIS